MEHMFCLSHASFLASVSYLILLNIISFCKLKVVSRYILYIEFIFNFEYLFIETINYFLGLLIFP